MEMTVKLLDRYENVLAKTFSGKIKEKGKVRKALKALKEKIFGKKSLMHESDFIAIREIINKRYDEEEEKMKKD